jgi:predicted metal-dependent hydrolase
VNPKLLELFQQSYQELRPRAPMPELNVQFYPYAGVRHTIRLRDGRLEVRLSDLIEGAPENILEALAHLLLAKLYRTPVEAGKNARYRRYVGGRDFTAKAQLIRQSRGRKRMRKPQGHVYNLEIIFEDLNTRYFHGLLGRPRLSWSQNVARRRLGYFDPAHNTIVVSRVFDDPRVPLYAIEYLVYHEMLHLKHPVKFQGSRRCVHSAAFVEEEKLFPRFEEAKNFLRSL